MRLATHNDPVHAVLEMELERIIDVALAVEGRIRGKIVGCSMSRQRAQFATIERRYQAGPDDEHVAVINAIPPRMVALDDPAQHIRVIDRKHPINVVIGDFDRVPLAVEHATPTVAHQ